MKKVLISALLSLTTFSAVAAEVHGASVIQKDDGSYSLLIDVQYSGGCAQHQFKLEMGRCLESYPVQCEAKLKDMTRDPCEGIKGKTVEIPFASAGLDDSYFERASLHISGDNNTSVSVVLP